jgi:hypothetical protein
MGAIVWLFLRWTVVSALLYFVHQETGFATVIAFLLVFAFVELFVRAIGKLSVSVRSMW